MLRKIYLCIVYLGVLTNCDENLQVLQKTSTSFLEKYTGYVNVVLIQVNIPENTIFASFKLIADELNFSIFKCPVRNISLYMKYGSLPVINPDDSKFPKSFNNEIHSEIYNIEFQSNKVVNYLNITSPEIGSYYLTVFLSYSDPRNTPITQAGLSPECFASMESTVYIKKIAAPTIVLEDIITNEVLPLNSSRIYKFYIPTSIDHSVLVINELVFSEKANKFIVRIARNRIPSNSSSDIEFEIMNGDTISSRMLWTIENSWYYLQFIFETNSTDNSTEYYSELSFSLNYFSSDNFTLSKFIAKDALEVNDNNQAYKTFYKTLTNVMPYQEYELVKQSSTDSFLYSFELKSELEASVPTPINMTNQYFTALKFRIDSTSETGGTLKYIMAFKPRVIKDGRKRILEDEPEENVIIACISKDFQVPMWPNQCVSNQITFNSSLILNKTVENATVQIPYPETGTWFATFKLFCGKCEPCKCPENCQKKFEYCNLQCEMSPISKIGTNACVENCRKDVIVREGCNGCDCDGPCKRNAEVCNSSVIFDISSSPCVNGGCSENGRCMFMVSDGIVYSTCVCTNNYRGWDCGDDSLANPYWSVLLELLLLVLSNLTFLPTVYVAFKRKYYIESMCYFSICFFSTFYHACDAGENIISFCITKLAALQFADFFCALLSIWVTLVAIADLQNIYTNISQMLGAIVLAFCTMIDKTALWIFAVPAISGLIIIGVNWYFKYKRVKQLFMNQRYLFINVPIGSIVVIIGLAIYALLQTTDNYKYLHSMWHCIMAIAVIILLPSEDTFQPKRFFSQT